MNEFVSGRTPVESPYIDMLLSGVMLAVQERAVSQEQALIFLHGPFNPPDPVEAVQAERMTGIPIHMSPDTPDDTQPSRVEMLGWQHLPRERKEQIVTAALAVVARARLESMRDQQTIRGLW